MKIIEEGIMDATAIIAISTVAYTIGTFLLWWTTRTAIRQSEKASKLSEEAFKLNILVTLIGLYRPIWGTNNSIFIPDQKTYDDIRKATSTTFIDLIKKEFPHEGNKILDILNTRYEKNSS